MLAASQDDDDIYIHTSCTRPRVAVAQFVSMGEKKENACF